MEKTTSPRISVIIPAYNAVGTIREALESVAAQSFKDCEVIVVDDGSTDGTMDQVSGVRCQVSELRVISLPENCGPAAARNRGIAEAKGEWIAFLDADDVWLPDKLKIQMELAKEHPETAMFCGGTIPFEQERKLNHRGTETRRGKKRRLWKSRPNGNLNGISTTFANWRKREKASCESTRRIPLEEFAVSNPVATSTVLVRKEAVEAVGGFDEQFRGPEDYDLWMRIAAKYPVMKTDVPLMKYRYTEESLSMNDRTFLPEVLRVLDKAYERDGALKDLRHLKNKSRGEQFFSASWMAFNRGDRTAALRCLIRSWRLCPGRVLKEKKEPFLRLSLLWRYMFGRTGVS